jgi:hypothetical protein
MYCQHIDTVVADLLGVVRDRHGRLPLRVVGCQSASPRDDAGFSPREFL